jgi:hypothetical protein
MPAFPPITVRQPQPSDIVDDAVEICGVGSGFEGVFSARVRDGNGAELSQVTITAGGTGILGNYHAVLSLSKVPATPQGKHSRPGGMSMPTVGGVGVVM